MNASDLLETAERIVRHVMKTENGKRVLDTERPLGSVSDKRYVEPKTRNNRQGVSVVDPDDIVQSALVLILRRKDRLGNAYVIDEDTIREAIQAVYRHERRRRFRESVAMRPQAYYLCEMPAVPARPARTERRYGLRPNLPKNVRIEKSELIEKNGSTVQSWLCHFPARPERASYLSLRSAPPSEGSKIKFIKRKYKGYSKGKETTKRHNGVLYASEHRSEPLKDTLEYIDSLNIKLSPRTSSIVRLLVNGYRKNIIAKILKVDERTIRRALAELRPHVRLSGRERGDKLPPVAPVAPVAPIRTGLYVPVVDSGTFGLDRKTVFNGSPVIEHTLSERMRSKWEECYRSRIAENMLVKWNRWLIERYL